MAKSGGGTEAIGLLGELEQIKRLLPLALLRNGASQAEIARAIGVSQPSISRMFPTGIGKATRARRSERQ
jgi:predicted XRE-type DNA-binding protein